MYDFGLRIEPWLYLFYALVAIYGYFHWKNEGSKNLEYKLTELPIKNHIGWILTGAAFTFLFGWLFDNFSTGESTYLDTFTTGFAVISTMLQTRKIKSNFIYWIIINIASTYLYFSREMKFYPWLMVLYVIISIYGARKWMQKT